METALLHLIFDIAASRLTHIAQHLGEHPFQRVVAHHPSRRAVWIFHRLIAVVANIEGSAIEMTRVLGGIAVTATELHHVLLRS